jgi:hypothetical protein
MTDDIEKAAGAELDLAIRVDCIEVFGAPVARVVKPVWRSSSSLLSDLAVVERLW